jgi:integrase/recombinase XerC
MAKRIIPNTVTEEELIAILNVEPKIKRRLAYALMFYQCMRVGEVVRLTHKNIDKQKLMIHIKESKNMKDRDIPISPFFVKRDPRLKGLKITLKQLPIDCSIRTLERSIKRIGRIALNKNLHPHILRHSGATWYLNKKKWDLRQLQRFLGHEKISTTTIYTHVSPQDLFNKMWEEE